MVTSLIGSLVGALVAKHKSQRRKHEQELEDINLIKKGLQSLLRDKLYEKLNKAKANKYVDINEKDNFINLWENYHALYENGVMDGIKDEFMDIELK